MKRFRLPPICSIPFAVLLFVACSSASGCDDELSNPTVDDVKQDIDRSKSPTTPVSQLPLILPRQPDGDGSLKRTGETKRWHKLTFTINGPFAHEQDNDPNPFLDYAMELNVRHEDGTTYRVPGYFAADGNAGETSADSGTMWRAHFAPDREGRWDAEAIIYRGSKVAIDRSVPRVEVARQQGRFTVSASDKTGVDLRGKGRLQFVNQRYLKYLGTGKYFLKAGADAPETLLGYADFDNTVAGKPKQVPLKTYAAARARLAERRSDMERGSRQGPDRSGKLSFGQRLQCVLIFDLQRGGRW